jgi:hypothetical protein
MTKSIPLTRGRFAIVDDEDAARVMDFTWHYMNNGYAGTTYDQGRKIYLHRFVMGAKRGEQVDHINMNKLDCRKENLRICSNQQNNANKTKQINNTSGYKGVTWDKVNKKWSAAIMVNKRSKKLGRFTNKEDAAREYDKAAKMYFGEFARTNFDNAKS